MKAEYVPDRSFILVGTFDWAEFPLARCNTASMSALIVLCGCPDAAIAERIASTLVAERLAACVNCIPGMMSTYRWQGKVQHEHECLLLIKTTSERFDAVRERIVDLHPYELPEVIAVDIALGHARYLAWIGDETGK